MAIPKNNWYVAGWSSELTQKPLARTLACEPVVMFRTASGRAIALEDRCCHRNLPLSHGRVEGEIIACGYHGLEYDCSGRCIRIPGQDQVPVGACVKAFPLEERDGVLWIWLGDPVLARVDAIVRYPIHTDPRWAHKATHYRIASHHELINDNLLDLSHVGYVHGKTIGGTPGAHSEAEMKTERTDNSVIVRRWMRNSVPPPTYQRAIGFTGRIDRWMEITFIPGLIRIYVGANDAGQGLDEKGQMDRLGIRIFNGITPETETSTHYFWTAAHNFKVDDPSVTEAFHAEIAVTFEEDRVVVEAQQERFTQFPDRKTFMIRADAGSAQARRIVQAMS
jgi:vanillate O-demethylase monooxygenase subunit